MEDNLRISTYIYGDGKIVQEIIHQSDDIMEVIMKQVIETQEQHVRESLIKLGWIPPNTK